MGLSGAGCPRMLIAFAQWLRGFRPQNKVELGSGGQPIVRFENEETCNIDVSYRFGVVDVGSWRDADSGIVPRGVGGLHLRPRLSHGLVSDRYLRLFYSPYG